MNSNSPEQNRLIKALWMFGTIAAGAYASQLWYGQVPEFYMVLAPLMHSIYFVVDIISSDMREAGIKINIWKFFVGFCGKIVDIFGSIFELWY